MPDQIFKSASHLARKINFYFKYIAVESKDNGDGTGNANVKNKATEKNRLSEAGPPTITGLALQLGFHSLGDFEQYEQSGEFAPALKRACLRVAAAYEKKLHHQSSAGAIFALKNMGWNEKPDNKTTVLAAIKNLTIEIINTGPKPVSDERMVDIS